MKHSFYISILMLIAWFLPCTLVSAQTPFDAFSPETSRIILDGDSIAAWRAEQQSQLSRRNTTHSRPDTIHCALIADLRNEQLLLVDIATHRPVAYAPFTDEIKNWLSVDPLVDKNISTSPYLYCNGNPIMFIDPDGRDIYNFDENGNYVGKVQQDGAHYGTMIYNGKSICFSFADPIHDPQAIDDGLIDKLQIVSDSELMQILNESGVFNSMNQENKYSFILNESNASRITSEGRMDYVISGIYRGASIVNYSNYLFVTNNQGKYSAHNTYNFGNYLWGAGAAALGIPYPIAWFGSNANNFLFDTSSRWHLDSRDDQYSIKQGFIWLQNRK